MALTASLRGHADGDDGGAGLGGAVPGPATAPGSTHAAMQLLLGLLAGGGGTAPRLGAAAGTAGPGLGLSAADAVDDSEMDGLLQRLMDQYVTGRDCCLSRGVTALALCVLVGTFRRTVC